MLNTIEINGTTLYIGADESGVGPIACDAAFALAKAGAVLVQLTDLKSDNVGHRLSSWLRHYGDSSPSVISRFIVLDNFRLAITTIELADRIKEATKDFPNKPIGVLLDKSQAMLPTYPNNHSLALLHELPLHLADTTVIVGIGYGHPATPPPRFLDYPADAIWRVQVSRTVIHTLSEIKPGDRIVRLKSKIAHGGLLVLEPVESSHA
jgi:hypothetical protein